MRRVIALLATLSLLAGSLRAQTAANELGLPVLRSFTAVDYQNHYQTWGGVQTPDGLVTIGAYGSLVQYDGHSWTTIPIEGVGVRGQALGPDGLIYACGDDFFGRLERDAKGQAIYHSLIGEIDGQTIKAPAARTMAANASGVFVGTAAGVIQWTPDGHIHVQKLSAAGRNRVFSVGGTIINYSVGEAIHAFRGGKWEVASTAEPLKSTGFHFFADPVVQGDLALFGLSGTGLFRIKADGTAERWITAADEALKPHQFFCGKTRSDGSIVIGTVDTGAFLLSADGKSFRHYPSPTVVPATTVLGIVEDREHGVWLSTVNGIVRLEPDTPATVFDSRNGLGSGSLLGIVRHNGVLYADFSTTLMRLEPGATPGSPARFVKEERVPAGVVVMSIAEHPSGLILATRTGLQQLTDKGVTMLVPVPEGVAVSRTSSRDPNRIYFVANSTLTGSAYYADGAWKSEGTLASLGSEIREMGDEPDGTLWVATDSQGVARISRTKFDTWEGATVKRYGEAEGITGCSRGMRLQKWGNEFVACNEFGNFSLDPKTDRWGLDARWNLPNKWHAYTLAQRKDAPVAWGPVGVDSLVSPGKLMEFRQGADGKITATAPFPALDGLLGMAGAQAILYEPEADGHGGVMWAKGMDNIVRFELREAKPARISWTPQWRGLRAEGQTVPVVSTNPIQLHYSTAPLEFQLAAPIFGFGRNVTFQSRLVGFQENWGEFTSDPRLVFTNLEGGPFTLEVRGKDADGQVSDTARLTFRVAPPWQRSRTAYTLYALGLLGGVLGFFRWRLAAVDRERKRLESLVAARTAELAVAKDDAENANKAKSAFLANMSHELRTPLNGVIGYTQVLMKDRDLSTRNRERLQVVRSSGEHLLRMINEVLDLSKIEAGKMELRPAPFHLPQLLRDIAAAQAPRAEEKGLRFDFAVASDLPETVVGDAQKLRQVIDNLLGNGLKFTATGAITLRAAKAGDEAVMFAVEDTGVGIAAADLAKIFQPFEQAASARPPEPGTGLGLAISQKFVALMGGQLEVESKPGSGSRFFFTVRLTPLATDAAAPAVRGQAIVGYTGARKRLLAVDDIAINRQVLRELLEPLGFTIDEADSGAAALQRIAETPPDLVFVDLRMPGMDGLEFVRQVRVRWGAQPKLIALSASVLAFNRDDAFAAGCDDFLPKPFREEDLLHRLGLALRLEWQTESKAAPQTTESAASGSTVVAQADLQALLAAAQRGEIAAIRKFIEEQRARGQTSALLDELDLLARQFRMEEIRALLTQAVAGAS